MWGFPGAVNLLHPLTLHPIGPRFTQPENQFLRESRLPLTIPWGFLSHVFQVNSAYLDGSCDEALE